MYNVYNMSGGSVYDSRIVFLRENLKFVLHSIPFATSDDDNNKHHPNVRFAEFILRYYYSLLYGYNFMCLYVFYFEGLIRFISMFTYKKIKTKFIRRVTHNDVLGIVNL